MKKKKIRKRIEKAAKSGQICRIYTESEPDEPSRFLPLAISDELVHMIKDGDPEAYGYSVRSLDVIKKVKVEDSGGKSVWKEISEKPEEMPELNIQDWPSVFKSLGEYGKVVIVRVKSWQRKMGAMLLAESRRLAENR